MQSYDWDLKVDHSFKCDRGVTVNSKHVIPHCHWSLTVNLLFLIITGSLLLVIGSKPVIPHYHWSLVGIS